MVFALMRALTVIARGWNRHSLVWDDMKSRSGTADTLLAASGFY
jgi:hypothetical protein